MANLKVSELNNLNTVDSTTIFLVSSNTTGTFASYKATIANVANSVLSNIGSNSNIVITQNGNVTITSNSSYSWKFGTTGNLTLPANTFSINFANGNQASAPLVDVTNTNGLTTTYYPTFVENRSNGQIVRADVDLTYRTDTNTLTVGNVGLTGNITAGNVYANSGTVCGSLLTGTLTTSSQPNITSVGTLANLSVTGNITAANVNSNVNGFSIGYRDVPQIIASNTTLSVTDAGKHYYSTTAGNLTLTIPNNATTSFSIGTAISIVVEAAGNVLVDADSNVTLYMAGNSTAANRVVGSYGMATLLKVATDTWFINGTGVN